MRSSLLIIILIISNVLISQENSILIEQPIRKWQCSLGFLGATENRSTPELLNKERQYVKLGLERRFLVLQSQIVGLLMVAYHHSERNGFYNYISFTSPIHTLRFQKKTESSFLKIFNGIKLDLNPKGNVSPYISGGLAISIPIQYKRTLNLIETNSLLNGLPVRQELKAKLPNDVGFFLGLGLSIKLSPNMRLNISGQVEAYPSSVYLSDIVSETELNGFTENIKITPQALLFGFSLGRSF